MAQLEWIKRLAQRAMEILESDGKTISRGTYESRAFTNALEKAALEQRVDIVINNATRIYTCNAVKESVKAMIRYRNRLQAEARDRPIPAGIGEQILAMNGPDWAPKIEQDLPPGDRD